MRSKKMLLFAVTSSSGVKFFVDPFKNNSTVGMRPKIKTKAK
jgi:hypothetical protein